MKTRLIRETKLSELGRRTEMRLKWSLIRSPMIWLFISLIFGPGCVSRVHMNLPEDTRAQLGTIGVVTGTFTPETQVPRARGKGEAAIVGAAQGLGIGLLAATGCLFTMGAIPEACLTGLGTPVLMVTEAVQEADAWVPEAVERQAEEILSSAVLQKNIQELLRDYVVQAAGDRSRQRIVTLKDQGPGTLDEETDYRHLAGRGIDSVLEVSIMNVGFVTPARGSLDQPSKPGTTTPDCESETDEIADTTDEAKEVDDSDHNDRPFSFSMSAHARVIRVRDNEVLTARVFSFESIAHKWSEWVDAEGCADETGNCIVKVREPFTEAIEQGYQQLAEQIISALGFNSG